MNKLFENILESFDELFQPIQGEEKKKYLLHAIANVEIYPISREAADRYYKGWTGTGHPKILRTYDEVLGKEPYWNIAKDWQMDEIDSLMAEAEDKSNEIVKGSVVSVYEYDDQKFLSDRDSFTFSKNHGLETEQDVRNFLRKIVNE